VRQAGRDYRHAGLEPKVRALFEYAVKLTREPAALGAADVQTLRDHGWDDQAIHDAIQVIAYFNYINRVADGVGIDPEPDWIEGADNGRF
jgi:uncharacterized peroxidase-related enzyme